MNKLHKDWDRFETFHKYIVEENPEFTDGVNAALEISKFARKYNLNVPMYSSFNVRFMSNMHYDWLIKANKLLKTVSEVPNFVSRIKRFFNNIDMFDSLAALFELEIALRLKLHGFEVSFVEERPQERTPDIEVRFPNQTFNLEVTTLNNPDEVNEKMKFYSLLSGIMSTHKVFMAGNLIEVSTKKHKDLLLEIEEKAIEVSKTGEKFKISREGVLVLEIVPRDKVGEFSFQGIELVYREQKNIEDVVNLKIKKKQMQLNVNSNPGILCIYGGSRTIDIEKLYTKSRDKIYPYLQTYSNISVLVLSSYSDFYQTKSLEDLKSDSNTKILKEIKPCFGEIEQSIIWKNNTADVHLPSHFVECYKDFEL